jgi:transposase
VADLTLENRLLKKRMARPVCKGVDRAPNDQSASTYPASEDFLPAKMEIRALRSS